MNKTTILVIVIGAAIGIAAYYTFKIWKPPAITPLITQATILFTDATTWIQQNVLQTIVMGASIFGGTLTFFNTIYTRLKSGLKQEQDAVKATAASATAEAKAEVSSLKESLAAKDTVIAQMQNGQQEVAPLLETIRTRDAQLQDAQKQIATLNQSLQTLQSPSPIEMKRRLEQEGFTVKQKVA